MFIDNQTFQLIDEPTNHLDIEGREVVADYLKQKQGFIVVSHDRHFLDQVIDHVLSIDRAKVQLYAGNYETWATAYQQENRSEWLEKRHLQKEIGRLKSTADTIERWAGRAESQKRKSVKSDQHADLDKGFMATKPPKS